MAAASVTSNPNYHRVEASNFDHAGEYRPVYSSDGRRMALHTASESGQEMWQTSFEEFWNQFQAILEHAPEAVLIVDADTGRFRFANENAAHLFKLNRSALLNSGPVDVSPARQPNGQSSAELASEKINQALRGTVQNFEWMHLDALGASIPCQVRLARLPSATRKLVCAWVTDLGERSRFDQELQRRNRELEALGAITLAVTSTLDQDEVLNTLLAHLAILLPYDSASIALWTENRLKVIAHRGFPENADLRVGEEAMNDRQRLQQVVNRNVPLIFPDVHKEGTWQIAPGLEYVRSWMGVPLTLRGRVVGVLNLDKAQANFYTEEHAKQAMALAQHVTMAIENARLYSELEQRVAERTAEIQAQIQQMEVILQSVDDAIVSFDQDQHILYVNPAWEKLTGYSASEVLGSQKAFFLERDETSHRTYHEMQDSLRAGETWRGILKGKRKDQSPFEIEMTVTPIKDEHGVIQRFVSVRRDVTEFRKVQEMKTRFVADLAHDLAAPIANLQLRLYLLKSNPQRAVENVTVMTRLVRQLDEMIKDLLTLIRLELGVLTTELESLDLNTIVMEVIEAHEPIASSKNLTVEFEATPNLPLVLADVKQAERFVSNLVANAINYTPSGGLVRITTGTQSNQVIFTIRDTGIGIAPEALPHIFERFYRSKEAARTAEGTGLGLAIVKEMVQRFGGTIDVQSTVGYGTQFTISLRVIDPTLP